MRIHTDLDPVDAIRGWLTAPAAGKGIYLADDVGDGWLFRSYADIAADALRIAGLLRERGGGAGDGVCVIMPTDFSCAAAFYAAWAAGGVFTPITPPAFGDLDEYIAHVASILDQAQPKVLVTAPGFADIGRRALAASTVPERFAEPLIVDGEVLAATPVPDLRDIASTPIASSACALLQFTSGSSGSPRGVQISWRNVATNVAMIADLLRWQPDEAMGSWLPLYHDMGLIGGFLAPVTLQEDLYLMRPDQFVRDPVRWLRAMTIAAHSPSPSFALGYVAHRVAADEIADLDLSGWRTLAVGSEPVELADLQSFARLVGPRGFDVSAFTLAYGLAESTLMVSSSRRDEPITLLRPESSSMRFGQPVTIRDEATLAADRDYDGSGWIAGLGYSIADSTVRVIGEDGRELPDDTLGEVIVTGGSVALGYTADRPESSGVTTIDDGVLHTADAGFIHRGQIFVLGRMGTTLKVRGRPVFMEDVESTIAADCGLTKGKLAAVALTDTGAQGIALFAEVPAGDWIPAARTLIRAQLGPAHTVTIITGPRGLIRRTSSGKPRRRHMWECYGRGDLDGAVTHESPGISPAAHPDHTAGAAATGPTPSLSRDRATALLDEALAAVTIPAECAVVFEGSLAEGFGNEGSDIDFLVIAAGADDLPTLPAVLFADGRRVEIRTRSYQQLRDQLGAVAAARDAGRIDDLDEDVLNRCQRYLRSTLIRGSSAVELSGLADVLTHDEFAEIVAQWWTQRTVAVVRHAVALRLLGHHDEARAWIDDGLTQAAKAWCARHGETYLETKWLPRQLDRMSPAHPGMIERITSLRVMLRDAVAGSDTWWPAADTLMAELLGVREWSDDDRVILVRVPGVTTWKIGGRTHVLRPGAAPFGDSGHTVFALSDRGGAVWRNVVFRQSLASIIVRAATAEPHGTDTDGEAAQVEHAGIGDALAEFVRVGLVGLAWRGDSPKQTREIRPALAMCEPGEPVTPAPFIGDRVLGLTGAVRGPGLLTVSPLPAARFAAAALELTWANVVAENAREDLMGAVRSRQGHVADVCAHRLVAMAVRMVLSAHGVHPLPADVAPPATLDRMLPVAEPRRTEIIDAVRHAGSVRFAAVDGDDAAGDDADTADTAKRAALDRLDALLTLAREVAGGADFPASFDSRETWRRTLEISYDWVRIGSHLGVRLPLAEAGDLIATGGEQPHTTSSATHRGDHA